MILTPSVVLFDMVISSGSNCETGGIKITVQNDTSLNIEKMYYQTSKEQSFSCSMLHKSCALTMIGTGDISIKIKALKKGGGFMTGNIGYADSCSSHEFKISELSSGDT